MDTAIKVALVAAVSALISAVVTSILAPHMNWRIEQKKQRLIRRRELYDRWLQLLANVRPPLDTSNEMRNRVIETGRLPKSFHDSLIDSADFQALRPYLSPQTVDAIESCADDFFGPQAIEAYAKIQNDLDRLRKDWDID